MARGKNLVILIGSLGADPETRYTTSNAAITTIRIATSEAWKDKQTGEMQERTEWHRIKFFGRLAEIAGEYLRKGAQVYVEGSLRTEKYTDKDGIERYTTDIIANEMQMLGSRGQGQQQEQRADRPQRAAGTGAGHGSGQGRGGAQQASRRAPAPAPAGDFNDPSDDDIPF